MKIRVTGKKPALALGLDKKTIAAAALVFGEKSAKRCGETFREIAIVIQDDKASDAAHRAILDVAGATDVITQRYDAIPPEPPGVYGELYINQEQAIRYAKSARVRRGWSGADEFLLYLAHGMDHLSGADDATEQEYARMRRRELAWLKAFREKA